jgi:hypothetical protein
MIMANLLKHHLDKGLEYTMKSLEGRLHTGGAISEELANMNGIREALQAGAAHVDRKYGSSSHEFDAVQWLIETLEKL